MLSAVAAVYCLGCATSLVKGTKEVTMHLNLRLCLISTIFFFVACKEPEMGFVFLENATSETLQITAEFQDVDTASKPLVFNLAPGERDGWRFISGKKDSEEADSTLQSLLVKSENCERQIDRPTLEKIIRKNGSWVLKIDGVLFSC